MSLAKVARSADQESKRKQLNDAAIREGMRLIPPAESMLYERQPVPPKGWALAPPVDMNEHIQSIKHEMGKSFRNGILAWVPSKDGNGALAHTYCYDHDRWTYCGMTKNPDY
jgi:hypothetical protein